ncbi:hypothetical protein [Nocardia sp. NPDC049526]|uniref:hypothetical protein n=1 Tax=Nocardia sp. NPDC049526 TaxID=3364316 RepID=UPI00378EC6C9
MVTFVQLRDAKPYLWQTAADDLLAVSKQADRTADNIHANGIKALEDNWPDHTGRIARDTLVTIAHRVVNVSILSRGAMTALDALQDAIAIAQCELHAAVEHAGLVGLTVDDSGRVGIAPGAIPNGLLLAENVDNAIGISRITTALNGLGEPPR